MPIDNKFWDILKKQSKRDFKKVVHCFEKYDTIEIAQDNKCKSYTYCLSPKLNFKKKAIFQKQMFLLN